MEWIVEKITIKHIRLPHPEQPEMFMHFTDVIINTGGRCFYSRVTGIESEGYQRAAFEMRQRPGFYRITG